MPAETQEQGWTKMAESALKQLVDIQSMIEIMSERLVALRDLRQQEYIKQDIRSLEGKLLKHFWKQLTTKCKVPKDHRTSVFQNYPSLNQWLTVVGVARDLNEKLNNQLYSVEKLLELNQEEISKLVYKNEGDSEDNRKLSSALEQLKNFREKNSNGHQDTEGIYWDSWCKATNENVQNGITSKECDNGENTSEEKQHTEHERHVDYNENIQNSAHSNSTKDFTSARNTSESHASPPHSSRSSLSSGGPPSPAYNSKMMSTAPYYTNSAHATPSPSYLRHVAQEQPDLMGNRTRQGSGLTTSTPPPVRSSKMQDTATNSNTLNKTSSGNHKLLMPFKPLKGAKSFEWQVGNHITAGGDESMTNSNLSLTSINTLPPPSSSNSSSIALFSTGKKRKKRPGNIVINNKRDPFIDPPDLLTLLRPVNRRPSLTLNISPESGVYSTYTSGSPLSPKTPMTPSTPISSDLWLRERDLPGASPVPPHTPKTPRFKHLRAFKEKIIGFRKGLRRNKSEERVADDVSVTNHPRPKVRSDTFPVINVGGIATSQHSGVTHSLSEQPIMTKHFPTDDSRHNSIHSSNSSISDTSRQPPRLHYEGSFDAGLLFSGMTTPGETSLLSGRANFAYDVHYFETTGTIGSMNFSGTDKTITTDMTDIPFDSTIGTTTSYKTEQSETSDDNMNDELEDTLEAEVNMMRPNLLRQASTTSTMNEEWDIPWDDLDFDETDLIGKGRVGAVYKGRWHGEVAIRVIDICHSDEFKLRAFKHEVMLYKKTRHDNIELFMGSCMNPPRLAIVTGFCKGKSLYQYIAANKDQTVNLHQAKIIAQHIAQGMGYLHSRGIIHKDLKSKNIFVDGKRVVITDFGLMGLHAISSQTMRIKPRTLQIPDGWLCYMAPEVIKNLTWPMEEGIDVVSCLPYTKESDVYAFGTVWYELLTGCWPFKEYPAESIIWQVGNRKKQSLGHLQGSKELKDILMACWAYDSSQRPDFSDSGIMGHLLRLPQAKILRRSSQPIKGNKKGGRLGGAGPHDRLFDPTSFTSVLHELAE